MCTCEFCLDFAQRVAKPGPERYRLKTATTPEQLKTCQLYQTLLENLHDPHLREPWLKDGQQLKFDVYMHRSKFGNEKGLYCECQVELRDEHEKFYSLSRLDLAIWADESSPAAEYLVTRSPYFVDSPRYACKPVNDWLQNCRLHCNHSLHDNDPTNDTGEAPLPTRVLQLTGSIEAPSVRLLESGGIRGTYCALSHCWGAEGKRPLATTRGNLRKHLLGIPFNQLPKTFRETVVLVRGIGIDFLWIDSLCIIQDDDQDWLSEAKEMGEVYRNATLVIAAAGSKDASRGLLNSERLRPAVLRIPFALDGVVLGSFNLSPLPHEWEYSPDYGPLMKRAWALQEWYLARRTLFFMPGGMTWCCDRKPIYEQGFLFDVDLPENNAWLELLWVYSQKKLTFPSDRIHALRGIVEEMQKTRQDRFLFDYGAWEDGLLEQIVWRRVSPKPGVSSLGLPTWCWAAIEGPKIWYPFLDDELHQPCTTQKLRITNFGSLETEGYTIQVSPSSQSLDARQLAQDMGVNLFEHHLFNDNRDYPLYSISERSSPECLLGIAIFDGDPICNARCFFISQTDRGAGLSGSLGYSLTHYQSSESEDASNDAENAEEEHSINDADDEESLQSLGSEAPGIITSGEDNAEVPDILRSSKTTGYVYWALILEPVEDQSSKKFRRVGLAMLYPHAFDASSKEHVHLEIV